MVDGGNLGGSSVDGGNLEVGWSGELGTDLDGWSSFVWDIDLLRIEVISNENSLEQVFGKLVAVTDRYYQLGN